MPHTARIGPPLGPVRAFFGFFACIGPDSGPIRALLPLGQAFGEALFGSGEGVFTGFQEYSAAFRVPGIDDFARTDVFVP